MDVLPSSQITLHLMWRSSAGLDFFQMISKDLGGGVGEPSMK